MAYLIFVLGYDLLHDQICDMECDNAYKYCNQVAIEFIRSSFYMDYRYSEYDALREFLKEEGYI